MSYPSPQFFGFNGSNFMREVYKYYNDLYDKVSKDSSKDVGILENYNNMFGIMGSEKASNLISYNEFLLDENIIVFYNFWTNGDAVDIANNDFFIKLQKRFSNTPKNLLISRNFLITYILLIFFGNNIYDIGRSIITNFRPNIYAQPGSQNYTPVLVSLKSFLGGGSVSKQGFLFDGAGNLGIKENGKVVDEENKGFIYYLCINDLYTYLTDQNRNLLEPDQKLNNDKSIYTYFDNTTGEGRKGLTEKQIASYREELSLNPIRGFWCGCFTPIPKFYYDKNLPSFNTPGNSPCDPLCYNRLNIGLYTPEVNDKLDNRIECTANICVIDNVSINSFSSSGNINIRQICTGCATGGGNCLCFLNVSTPDLVNKITSGDDGMATQVKYLQVCPNSICFNQNPVTGVETPVNCNEYNIPSTGGVNSNPEFDGRSGVYYPERISNSLWFVLLLSLIVFIIYQPKIFFNL